MKKTAVDTVILAGSARGRPRGCKLLDAAPPQERFQVTVRIRIPPTAPSLSEHVVALGLQGPRQRQYLSREQFLGRFGADAGDVAQVEAFAHAHGLTVVRVDIAAPACAWKERWRNSAAPSASSCGAPDSAAARSGTAPTVLAAARSASPSDCRGSSLAFTDWITVRWRVRIFACGAKPPVPPSPTLEPQASHRRSSPRCMTSPAPLAVSGNAWRSSSSTTPIAAASPPVPDTALPICRHSSRSSRSRCRR